MPETKVSAPVKFHFLRFPNMVLFDSLLGEARFANVRDVVDWGKSFKWVGDTWLFWEERTPLTRIGFST